MQFSNENPMFCVCVCVCHFECICKEDKTIEMCGYYCIALDGKFRIRLNLNTFVSCIFNHLPVKFMRKK